MRAGFWARRTPSFRASRAQALRCPEKRAHSKSRARRRLAARMLLVRSEHPDATRGFVTKRSRLLVAIDAGSTGSGCHWLELAERRAGLQERLQVREELRPATGDQLEHRTPGLESLVEDVISNPARAALARSTCASPVPAPPPGSSP